MPENGHARNGNPFTSTHAISKGSTFDRTYEEWKRLFASLNSVVLSLLIVPMRNGNVGLNPLIIVLISLLIVPSCQRTGTLGMET